jgi:predicted metal-dependent phosphoesterase TrpH
MARRFAADLHIHTCLSPCGELEMSPKAIVEEALRKEIDIIAICDHNSAENAPAVIEAARGTGLEVLSGIEITTREEVHIAGLFDKCADALKVQEFVYRYLYGENDEEAFGMQPVVNAEGEVLGFNKRLLIGAADISVEEAVRQIHAVGGLAIAAHIDREAFGIIAQLGFIPDGLELDALEISRRITLEEARERFQEYKRYFILRSSDAHRLKEIGQGVAELELNGASFAAIRDMLVKHRRGGR